MSKHSKKNQAPGCLWWLFIGWWWWPCRLVFYDAPKRIITGLAPARKAQKAEPVNRGSRVPAQPTVPPMPPVKPPAPAAPAPVAPAGPTAAEKKYKVTGLQYYMDNLITLAHENYEYDLSKRELIDDGLTEQRVYQYEFYPHKTELVPEPDNPNDPKAIKVVVNDQHIGYIKAGSCGHLLRVIREGRIVKIDCDIGGGRYKYLSLDDYTESGKEIYTLEKDEAPFYVHLKITEKPEA